MGFTHWDFYWVYTCYDLRCNYFKVNLFGSGLSGIQFCVEMFFVFSFPTTQILIFLIVVYDWSYCFPPFSGERNLPKYRLWHCRQTARQVHRGRRIGIEPQRYYRYVKVKHRCFIRPYGVHVVHTRHHRRDWFWCNSSVGDQRSHDRHGPEPSNCGNLLLHHGSFHTARMFWYLLRSTAQCKCKRNLHNLSCGSYD